MKLAGKVALVTGAGRRVGRAIALACADAGAAVAVHYRSSAAGARQVVDAIRERGGEAESFAADLTAPEAARGLADAVAAAFGGVDVLVNSAAAFVRGDFVGMDDAAWERAWRVSFETNLLAPARLTRLCAQSLAARAGAVVNVLEVGATHAWPSYAHHTAAKAGLAHLTRTLAVALAPRVRVNGVSPGIAAFPPDMPEAERAALVDKTLLGRPGTPDDVAAAVVFLAAHPYITGAIVPVDGGWSVPR
ncbi:MAG: SDR family oxidoreductase [Deltaproteobacteria bacterium]|nr:MAG: SDR family oxidoreductase [Deltaproteobacteria bacterium]